MAELVDALDLGSSGVTRESSSLSFRTNMENEMQVTVETSAENALERKLRIQIPAARVEGEITDRLRAMGKRARLIPVPTAVLRFGATLLGKPAVAHRLLGSLQVDISKARELLEWQPRHSVEDGLRRCFVTSSQGGRV